MKKLIMVVLTALVFLISSCAAFSLGELQSEGAKASGFCIKGGYAMAGGLVTGAKINEDFQGTVEVGPDCGVKIKSE